MDKGQVKNINSLTVGWLYRKNQVDRYNKWLSMIKPEDFNSNEEYQSELNTLKKKLSSAEEDLAKEDDHLMKAIKGVIQKET